MSSTRGIWHVLPSVWWYIPTEVVISHVQLLGGCKIDLLWLLVVICRLLRRLSRLMMMVVMATLPMRWNIARSWGPWRDSISCNIWALTMKRSSVVWLMRRHPFFVVDWCFWDCSRTIQIDLLSVIQKVWEGSLLTGILIDSLRYLRSSVSRRSWMASFFTAAFLALIQILMLNWLMCTRCWRYLSLLALPHWACSFWNWSSILSVASVLMRSSAYHGWYVLLWILHWRVLDLDSTISLRAVALCCLSTRVNLIRRVLLVAKLDWLCWT